MSFGIGAYWLVELDLDDRARAALVELLRLDLADVHAGDPDVGLLRERRGLGHVHLEAVALGLERHRAAEREPQEHQQAEHDSVNTTIAMIRPMLGVCLIMASQHAPSAAERASASRPSAVEQAGTSGVA